MFNRYTSKQTYRTVPPSLGTPEEARRTVETAEADFEARLVALSAAVSRECAEDGIRILRLTGPTCSGKTTAAGKLTEALEAAGLSVYPISLDDFLSGPSGTGGASPGARRDAGLRFRRYAGSWCHGSLRPGAAEDGGDRHSGVQFHHGQPRGNAASAVPAGEKPVFLFEGIQALYPPVTALFADIPSPQRVYFGFARVGGSRRDFSAGGVAPSAPTGAGRGGTGRDPRLYPGTVESVRANEETSILPLCQRMRLSIDSAMPFELHMLKPYRSACSGTTP